MKDWQQLQLLLYRDLQKEANSRIQKKNAAFSRYEKEFLKDQRQLKSDTLKNLIFSVNKADITFIGDFHTLRQSQRFLVRLLRDRRLRKPDTLALEVVSNKDLKLLKEWQKSPTPKNESALRKALQLERHWGGHWEAYRDLFVLCTKMKIQIIPLFDSHFKIKRRDQNASDKISRINERTWVFMGEFHCARPHLPLKVLEKNPHKKLAVLQQNDDRATLKLLKESSNEASPILRAPEWKGIQLFCVLHTPLWIKYQSLLEHIIQTEDRGTGEILDASDQIRWSLKTLLKFLNDPRYPSRTNETQIYQVNVYRSDDPHFYRSIVKLPKKEQRMITQQLKLSGLAVSMPTRQIFLSEITINSCSQAAGLYLYQAWSTNTYNTHNFYSSILLEAFSFFLSKLLNHSRRALPFSQLSEDLTKFYLSPPPATRLQAKLGRNKIEMGQKLGRAMADSLFEAFLAGEFSRSRLIRLLKTPVKSEDLAFTILTEIYSIAQSFNKKIIKSW